MFKLLSSLLVAAALFNVSSTALAATADDGDTYATADDADTVGYDKIVDQLSRENATRAASLRAKTPTTDVGYSSIDSVMMHAGVGFANGVQSLTLDDGTSAAMKLTGFQVAFGIDLFSPNWQAEGTLRNLHSDGDSKLAANVQEFELKALYKDRFAQRLGFHAGGGVTGRYLKTTSAGVEKDYTTPMSVAVLGGDVFFGDRVSLGADISGRNALIGETIDHNSFDLTLRLDAHF